jgi:hypothetical protein
MSAGRSRSIKEFFKCKELESQQEDDNPSLSASSDEETERRDLSDSANQGRCFYVFNL